MDDKTLKLLDYIVKNMLTKQDAKDFLTKSDAKSFLTKQDAKNFATKDDLHSFATKDDLRNFATKDDLHSFATKDDLVKLNNELRQEIKADIDEAFTHIGMAPAEAKADRSDVHDLDRRVTRIEEKIFN